MKPALALLAFAFLAALTVTGQPWAAEPGGSGSSLPASATKPAVFIPGVVTRSLFTRDMKNREPVDSVSSLENRHTRVIYFTEIRGMAGQNVLHRWEYNGKVVMEVPIRIKTARWRAYSVKTLPRGWTGEWKASVVDAGGGSLSVNTFTYVKSTAEAPVSPR